MTIQEANKIEWKEVLNSDGSYWVSEAGHVYSLKSDRMLSPRLRGSCKPGGSYPAVLLYYGVGEAFRKDESVHKLMMEAFVRPQEKGEVVDHIDGNPLNNTLANLRYTTPQGNADNAVRLDHQGKGERNGRALLNAEQVLEIRELFKEGFTAPQIARHYPVTVSTLNSIKHRKLWKHLPATIEVN